MAMERLRDKIHQVILRVTDTDRARPADSIGEHEQIIAAVIAGDGARAAALMIEGVTAFRRSESRQLRGPLCGMGICFECRVRLDGLTQVRSCLTLCQEGMEIATDE